MTGVLDGHSVRLHENLKARIALEVANLDTENRGGLDFPDYQRNVGKAAGLQLALELAEECRLAIIGE